jgi:hypothetical protein
MTSERGRSRPALKFRGKVSLCQIRGNPLAVAVLVIIAGLALAAIAVGLVSVVIGRRLGVGHHLHRPVAGLQLDVVDEAIDHVDGVVHILLH